MHFSLHLFLKKFQSLVPKCRQDIQRAVGGGGGLGTLWKLIIMIANKSELGIVV